MNYTKSLWIKAAVINALNVNVLKIQISSMIFLIIYKNMNYILLRMEPVKLELNHGGLKL